MSGGEGGTATHDPPVLGHRAWRPPSLPPSCRGRLSSRGPGPDPSTVPAGGAEPRTRLSWVQLRAWPEGRALSVLPCGLTTGAVGDSSHPGALVLAPHAWAAPSESARSPGGGRKGHPDPARRRGGASSCALCGASAHSGSCLQSGAGVWAQLRPQHCAQGPTDPPGNGGHSGGGGRGQRRTLQPRGGHRAQPGDPQLPRAGRLLWPHGSPTGAQLGPEPLPEAGLWPDRGGPEVGPGPGLLLPAPRRGLVRGDTGCGPGSGQCAPSARTRAWPSAPAPKSMGTSSTSLPRTAVLFIARLPFGT